MFKYIFMAVVVTVSLLSGSAIADSTTHPYADYNVEMVGPKHIARGEKEPREAWVDGLTFRPCSKSANELTPVERYIVRGLRPTEGNPPGEPGSWISLMTMIGFAYASNHNTLPTVMTDDTLHDLGFNGPHFAEQAAWYRNPITNEYPRFDNPEFTPGGVYLRMLTAEEANFHAQWNHQLAGLVTLKKSATTTPGEIGDAELIAPVLYYRFYGETGLLDEGITYLFSLKEQ
jgi:hypothetical protein